MNKVDQQYVKQYMLNISEAKSEETINLLVLNIMPNKLETEGQIINLITGYSENVSFTFMYPETHHFKSDVLSSLKDSYATLREVKDQYFDGLIVTGAPIEQLNFEDVDYWQEFTELVDWADTHVKQSLYICWASQAALYYHYGIQKHAVNNKVFGIFKHHPLVDDQLLSGLGSSFDLPHSRHTTIQTDDINSHSELTILADNPKTGPQIIVSKDRRETFITGHPEYNTETLADEYFRDLRAGKSIEVPENYFYANDPQQKIINHWHEAGSKILQNWLNQLNVE